MTEPAPSGTEWQAASWRRRPAAQQPTWPDEEALKRTEARLATLPPLVVAGEARQLTSALAEVAQGRAFLLQAGDCAESFADFAADNIRDKLKVVLQMAVALTYAAGVPVVKVGRIAGQFAKPRSSPTERIGDVELDSFRGHMVNDETFDADARRPDPTRLVTAYHQSASTLNLLRAFAKGGFADLSHVHAWNQQFVASSTEGRRYERVASEIDRALRFMRACGIDLDAEGGLHQVDFWTSHEALILNYEEALTRQDSLTGDWVDTLGPPALGRRAHPPAGRRPRRVPVRRHQPGGVPRSGRTPRADDGRRPVRAARPRPRPRPADADHPVRRRQRRPGCCRRCSTRWPRPGHPVVWACDPMHGNTFTSDGGRKTRRFDDILAELQQFFARPPPGRHLAGRRPRRADRRRRHRVPRRRRGDRRGRPRTSGTRRPATRGSTPVSRSTWPSRVAEFLRD